MDGLQVVHTALRGDPPDPRGDLGVGTKTQFISIEQGAYARTSNLHRGGRGFDPCLAHQTNQDKMEGPVS
jgi:hypothetical protein